MTIPIQSGPYIYKDETLACVVQSIDFVYPWATLPTVDQFRGSPKPNREAPIIDWVIQGHEDDIRATLTRYLSENLGIDVGQRIINLPQSYVVAGNANILYNIKSQVDYLIPPRLEHEFCTSMYAFPVYWLVYYYLDYQCSLLVADTSNEGGYRYLKLYNLQESVGAVMRAILVDNPKLTQSGKVIVNATVSTLEKTVIYCDRTQLGKWISQGGTLDKLCVDWINSKTNPTPK